MEIMEIWKYANMKIVKILTSAILYVSSLKCMGYICMYVRYKFVDK